MTKRIQMHHAHPITDETSRWWRQCSELAASPLVGRPTSSGAKLREAAAVVMCLSELEPSELLCGISGLDSSTLRNVALVGVLEFKRATESDEEFRVFIARLLEGLEPPAGYRSGAATPPSARQTV